jgi:hypothetical protein
MPERETESIGSDNQVGGSHYKNLWCDPATYAEKNELTPLEFSVIKYVTRHRSKNGLEDLKKAKHFLEMLIQHNYEKEASK